MILLIQFRSDRSGPHEIKCVHNVADVEFQDLQIINAYADHVSSDDIVRQAQEADAVLLGGCGENADDKTAVFELEEKIQPVVDKIIKEDIPALGLCFGHQLIAGLSGGEVGAPEKQAETGVAEIYLTEAGREDDLFNSLSSPFHSVVGHKVSVIKKPDKAVHLAKSQLCKYQALRYGDNVYTCQFHPELDTNDLFERLELYPEYMENEIEYDKDMEVEAKQVTTNFFERYL